MQRMSRRHFRLLRETVAFSSDAAAGIAGLPDRRLRRPRRGHRPARREDVPAEDATQSPYPLEVDRHEFRPVRDENPMTTATAGPTHEPPNAPQAPAMRHRGPATLSTGPLPALCLHR